MELIEVDSLQRTADFVLTDPPSSTRRFENRPSLDHDVFSVQDMIS